MGVHRPPQSPRPRHPRPPAPRRRGPDHQRPQLPPQGPTRRAPPAHRLTPPDRQFSMVIHRHFSVAIDIDPSQAILFVIDGGKALRKAIRDVFGAHALVHRCQRHKERNVCDLLPERDRDPVRARMRAAWALTDPALARDRLELLAAELDRTWPDAAGSLREGLEDTLTLMRLGITGQLAKTLCSTNPCESMIEVVRHTQRNVKRWHDGDMRKRWTAAGMLVAEQQFRRIIGYRHLAKLVIAVERHAIRAAATNPDPQAIAEPVTV